MVTEEAPLGVIFYWAGWLSIFYLQKVEDSLVGRIRAPNTIIATKGLHDDEVLRIEGDSPAGVKFLMLLLEVAGLVGLYRLVESYQVECLFHGITLQYYQ